MRVLSLHNQIIAPLDLSAAQRIARAIRSVVSIDKAVHQMLVAPMGDAQTGGLDNPRRLFSDVIDPQAFGIETFCIPHGRDEHLMYRFVDADYAAYCTRNPLRRGQVEGRDYLIVQ